MEEIRNELERVVKELFGVDVSVEVKVAEGQMFSDGREVDFASNVAMRLTKELHRAPREIAEEILNVLNITNIANNSPRETKQAENDNINILALYCIAERVCILTYLPYNILTSLNHGVFAGLFHE